MPTLVFSNLQVTATSGTLTSTSFTPQAGDIIVVKISDEGVVGSSYNTPTGGGWTYTSRAVNAASASTCYVQLWTAPVTAGGTAQTVSATPVGTTTHASMLVELWRNGKLAATPATCNASGSGAPSTPLTTVAAGSAVSWVNTDFIANSPAGHTYNTTSATPTEDGLDDQSTQFYVAYYAWQPAPTAGSQTLGLTAPVGQGWTLIGIEIQDAGAASFPVRSRNAGGQLRNFRQYQPKRRRLILPEPGKVTASIGGASSSGISLAVRVLVNAAAPGSQPGTTFSSNASGNTPQFGPTPAVSGSLMYGAAIYSPGTAATVDANTTAILNATPNVATFLFRETALSTGGTAVTYGGSAPTMTAGGFVQAEIKASGGTVAEDGSTPAPVSSASGTAVSTQGFSPPAGSLLVALFAGFSGGAGTDSVTITDTLGLGLTWTQVVSNATAGNGNASIWVAQVPGGSGTIQAAATLTGDASIDTSAAVQQAGATLAGTGSLAATAVQQAGATLAGDANIDAATATQRSSGTLGGTGSLGNLDITGAPATLGGTGALTTAATQGAGATLGGTASLTAAVTLSAVATLSGTGSLTAQGNIDGSATLGGAGSVSTAAGAGGSVGGQGSITTGAIQGAPTSVGGQGSLSTAATQGTTGTVLGGGGSVTTSATQGAPASLGAQGSLSTAAVQRAPATLSGTGSVTAPGTISAPATLAAAGSLAAVAVQGAPTALSAAASLSAAAVQGAPTSLSGAGSVTGGVVQGGSLGGAGSLNAPGTLAAPATLAGTGSVAAAGTQGTTGTALAGTGSLAATVIQRAVSTLAGTGSLTTTPPGQSGQLSGTGSLNAPGSAIQPPAVLSGAGSLAATVIQRAVTTLAGSGSLAAAGAQGTTGTTLAGTGSLAGSGTSRPPQIKGGSTAWSVTGPMTSVPVTGRQYASSASVTAGPAGSSATTGERAGTSASVTEPAGSGTGSGVS